MRCKDPTLALRVTEDGDDVTAYYGPSLEYEEDHILQGLYSPEEFESQSHTVERHSVTLFEQTSRILDHMWCANDPMQVNDSQREDWHYFRTEMQQKWTAPLLHTMLLFGAMVICRIPLSAAGWVNRFFVPVYVKYGHPEAHVTLGLLAKTARQEQLEREKARVMFSVGQHLPARVTYGTPIGKDHFLVDPARKVPVAILPDFLPDERTNEEYTKFTDILYHEFRNEHGILVGSLSKVFAGAPSS
ncbi:hypothetical protein QBC34DRAFT_456276 [Podospora aff. communis PSN243]|uniref:Uncharacterized protein n=1 Tax=Podospora aff. communis PSN243 TaxID=3040156 RepID=A0AAV9GY13_9PEZI|nr:hypothetical protein QBC34DRAFT_456276 [Podospora aff. communis PSN243]